ncbi:metal ABC transporter permease [Vannielia litorea]|uniref:metal ABC transporter permease n=1 Tax=Vannielia litorea TaxID=1217970 RepID=UPI001C984BBA|nr:metal ABC transporter permease [Vannielia litorea]MBY6152105.1 metal ABC transporter permease [Vannielia litorea]
MFDDFLIRAAFAGVGVALVSALLGCFVVWRRMAYFGDATAHAALLGVALSLGFDIAIPVGVGVAALAMGLAVGGLSGRRLASDTLLGVLAHAALASGLLAVSLIPGGARLDLEAYLFGDILAVSRSDLGLIWGGAVLVISVLIWRWQALLVSVISADLARASGVDPRRENLVMVFALALTVAVAIKVVGALLITALLILPAAAARPLARTPEVMAVIAAAIGVASSLGGLRLSYQWDSPTGPTIVCTAAAFFALTMLLRPVLRPLLHRAP